MRRPIRKVLLTILILFLFPLAVHAGLYFTQEHAGSFRNANWSSTGMLLPANADKEARLLVFTGRTGRWRGIFSVHSWIVLKAENATTWSRYDVVGWGQPVRMNGWAPDSHWFGNTPRVLVDVRGAQAAALIPKVKAAIDDYRYNEFGDYRLWPGPNSNTFVATLLRAVPELGITLPANAVGKDFRTYPYAGLSDSGTGRMGRGPRAQYPRPRGRARSAPSRRQAPGLRPARPARRHCARRTGGHARRISTSPVTMRSAASTRPMRSGSLRTITAIRAPNNTLVSRNAATIAIGATVMAQIAMP
jgi:Protein of unknown function (DUF3750)